MIDKKLKEELTKVESKKGVITFYSLIGGIFFLSVMVVLNLQAASKFAMKEGISLLTLIKYWIEGFDISQQYTGVYLKSIDRLETAIILLVAAIICMMLAIKNRRECKRNKKLIKIIKNCDQWPEE